MAMISHVITDHFAHRDDLRSIVEELDAGIYTVGLSVRTLREMLLHGRPSAGTPKCDTEHVAASAQVVLAYIGYLAGLIDRLEQHTNPSTHAPAQEAAGR